MEIHSAEVSVLVDAALGLFVIETQRRLSNEARFRIRPEEALAKTRFVVAERRATSWRSMRALGGLLAVCCQSLLSSSQCGQGRPERAGRVMERVPDVRDRIPEEVDRP
ncbi:hypothetical protein SISNIDRAFT_471125 [Sistotremastrum niveocremeum HHB9708]|uniref:Uncharacterized protein n=1 Tax=Sistotremastrum niveocremeum HHB9708 TaxID=1314777 RepID=A0A164N2E6_9AGAM|nr:hypothetical protein SISNIDRAFT_471125 [Sistotremastrum niveocremeum HHB9708]